MPNEVRIDPLSELLLINRDVSDVSALRLLGIVPEKEQLYIISATNDVMLPIKEGIEPPKELLPISRVVNFVKALIADGIGPINLLKARVKSVRDIKLPNEVGIVPLSEFDDIYNLRSDDS